MSAPAVGSISVGRPESRPGGRPVVVHTRLTLEEAAEMDALRASLSRAEYLRWLLLKEKKAHQK